MSFIRMDKIRDGSQSLHDMPIQVMCEWCGGPITMTLGQAFGVADTKSPVVHGHCMKGWKGRHGNQPVNEFLTRDEVERVHVNSGVPA